MPTVDVVKTAAVTTTETAATTTTYNAVEKYQQNQSLILPQFMATAPTTIQQQFPITVNNTTTTTTTTATTTTHLEQYQQRLQLYNYALHIERFRCPVINNVGAVSPVYNQQQTAAAAAAAAMAMAALSATTPKVQQQQQHHTHYHQQQHLNQSHHHHHHHPQDHHHQQQQQQRYLTMQRTFLPPTSTFSRLFHHEEPKPQHSYIGLIAMAILSSNESKLVLSDIYQYILDNYPYFRTRGPGWRNSIRHNLSLNDCFVKSGRSANGKGHYWSIHPANLDDFRKGDFRRRKAQRKVRRHMGLTVDDNGTDSPSPPPITLPPSIPPQTMTPTVPTNVAMNYAKWATPTAAAILAAATIQQQQQQQQQPASLLQHQTQLHEEQQPVPTPSSARIVQYYSQHLATTFEQHHHYNHHHHQQQQQQQPQQIQPTVKYQGLMTMAEMLTYRQRQQQQQYSIHATNAHRQEITINQENDKEPEEKLNKEYNNKSNIFNNKNNNNNNQHLNVNSGQDTSTTTTTTKRKRQFDVASLLAPDVKPQQQQQHSQKITNKDNEKPVNSMDNKKNTPNNEKSFTDTLNDIQINDGSKEHVIYNEYVDHDVDTVDDNEQEMVDTEIRKDLVDEQNRVKSKTEKPRKIERECTEKNYISAMDDETEGTDCDGEEDDEADCDLMIDVVAHDDLDNEPIDYMANTKVLIDFTDEDDDDDDDVDDDAGDPDNFINNDHEKRTNTDYGIFYRRSQQKQEQQDNRQLQCLQSVEEHIKEVLVNDKADAKTNEKILCERNLRERSEQRIINLLS